MPLLEPAQDVVRAELCEPQAVAQQVARVKEGGLECPGHRVPRAEVELAEYRCRSWGEKLVGERVEVRDPGIARRPADRSPRRASDPPAVDREVDREPLVDGKVDGGSSHPRVEAREVGDDGERFSIAIGPRDLGEPELAAGAARAFGEDAVLLATLGDEPDARIGDRVLGLGVNDRPSMTGFGVPGNESRIVCISSSAASAREAPIVRSDRPCPPSVDLRKGRDKG